MSEGAKPEASRWQTLHERGLKMKDRDIDFITQEVIVGTKEALDFFGIKDSYWPQVIFSSDMETIGYVPERKVLNIPLPYLNKVAGEGNQLKDQEKLVYLLPGGELFRVSYPYWLRLAGREETIHYLQNSGSPQLMAELVGQDVKRLSDIERLTCDVEVEARKVVDQICAKMGEKPAWAELDSYLQLAYPSEYNQPIAVLLAKKLRI